MIAKNKFWLRNTLCIYVTKGKTISSVLFYAGSTVNYRKKNGNKFMKIQSSAELKSFGRRERLNV